METKVERLLVSDQDHKALTHLAESGSSDVLQQLEEEMDRAEILPLDRLPADVVTMHSTVSIEDLDTGQESLITLVYPQEADAKAHKVSILAPMGIALIGHRTGQSSEWPMPNGKFKHFRIKSVTHENAA